MFTGGGGVDFTATFSLTGFVCGLLSFGLFYIWYSHFPLWFSLILTFVLSLSMYYQVMFWIKQLSLALIMMNIEDRIVNEYTYQIIKMGYKVTVETVIDDETRQDSDQHYRFIYDMPKWKRIYLLPITLLNVMLFPAWRIREFDGMDDVWG